MAKKKKNTKTGFKYDLTQQQWDEIYALETKIRELLDDMVKISKFATQDCLEDLSHGGAVEFTEAEEEEYW